jgi:hypothetical protein
MLRTTIYLDEETVLALRQLATLQKHSQTDIIRKAPTKPRVAQGGKTLGPFPLEGEGGDGGEMQILAYASAISPPPSPSLIEGEGITGMCLSMSRPSYRSNPDESPGKAGGLPH